MNGEFLKLVRWVQMLEMDIKLKESIIDENRNKFESIVNKTFEEDIQLNQYFENPFNLVDSVEDLDNISDTSGDVSHHENYVDKSSKIFIPDNIKSSYRECVKLSHPDKVDNKFLLNFYKRLTVSYNQGNLIEIYKIFVDMDIDFVPTEFDLDKLSDYIQSLQVKRDMVSSNYIFRWSISPDNRESNNILKDFIISKIKNY